MQKVFLKTVFCALFFYIDKKDEAKIKVKRQTLVAGVLQFSSVFQRCTIFCQGERLAAEKTVPTSGWMLACAAKRRRPAGRPAATGKFGRGLLS
ncbi:hypothetical protein V8J88_03510 [Massilia sp. W12]|uniref:hypothetical protein n=1 Tax=Massilia sp. W12 TaxID=3126507 RepID=UPI0030D2E2CC